MLFARHGLNDPNKYYMYIHAVDALGCHLPVTYRFTFANVSFSLLHSQFTFNAAATNAALRDSPIPIELVLYDNMAQPIR